MTTIAPLTPEHFETVARWLSNPEINRWLSGDWRDKATTASTIAIAVRNRRNRLYLVSQLGQPCGVVALSDIDAADNTAMVWYFLGDRSFSGQGVTSEAVRQMVAVGLSDLGLKSIYAWAMETNVNSIRLLTKAGFKPAGRIRRSSHFAGRQIDRLYFDLTAEDLERS
jgi:RimJ/RimL family protein N-acetyltransferase